MTDQPMLSISLDAIRIYRDYLSAALAILTTSQPNLPATTDDAIDLLQRLHAFILQDIQEHNQPPGPT